MYKFGILNCLISKLLHLGLVMFLLIKYLKDGEKKVFSDIMCSKKPSEFH